MSGWASANGFSFLSTRCQLRKSVEQSDELKKILNGGGSSDITHIFAPHLNTNRSCKKERYRLIQVPWAKLITEQDGPMGKREGMTDLWERTSHTTRHRNLEKPNLSVEFSGLFFVFHSFLSKLILRRMVVEYFSRRRFSFFPHDDVRISSLEVLPGE